MICFTQFMILFLNFLNLYLCQECTDFFLNYEMVKYFENTLISDLSLWSKSGIEHSASCAVMCNDDADCVSFFYNTHSGVCTAHSVQFYSTEPSIADPGSLYYTLPIDRRDCAEILSNDASSKDGVYIINPLDAKGHFKVYCDMTTDGGGWTVFQRRQDGSVDFYRTWADYKSGFGDLTGEFWLGNDRISRLTTARSARLRIDMLDYSGRSGVALYTGFRVENEAYAYTLTVNGYSGNRGDSLAYHNGMKFTTRDRDNDYNNKNCAVMYTGAWWYNKGHLSNLNGRYADTTFGKGINWQAWHGHRYSLRRTEMKLRPAF